MMTETLLSSGPLFDRVTALEGCQGDWFLDLRDGDYRAHDVHRVPGYAPRGCGRMRFDSVAEVLAFCCERRWRGCRLLFSPGRLNGDCSWPGGYDAPAAYASNARVFCADFSETIELWDGDYDGTALDVRFITPEMLEVVEGLENYPVLDEEDMGELELERQGEAWESWGASDWRDALARKLQTLLEVNGLGDDLDADDLLDAVDDDKLLDLFDACQEAANEYWQEESDGGQWIDIDKVAEQVGDDDLRELVGRPDLLSAGQQWRREPYPWPGAPSSPLVGGVSHG